MVSFSPAQTYATVRGFFFPTRSCFLSLTWTHLQWEPNLKLVFSCHSPMLVFKDYMQIMPALPSALPPFYFLLRRMWRAAVYLEDHGCCSRKPKLFPKVKFLRIGVFSSAYNRNGYEHLESLDILPGLRRCGKKQSGYERKSSWLVSSFTYALLMKQSEDCWSETETHCHLAYSCSL